MIRSECCRVNCVINADNFLKENSNGSEGMPKHGRQLFDFFAHFRKLEKGSFTSFGAKEDNKKR